MNHAFACRLLLAAFFVWPPLQRAAQPACASDTAADATASDSSSVIDQLAKKTSSVGKAAFARMQSHR